MYGGGRAQCRLLAISGCSGLALATSASVRKADLRDAMSAQFEAHRIRPELSAEDVRPLVGRRGVKILGDAELLA